MAGGYVSNNSERINDEIKELTLQIEKIKLEMENKIGGKNAEANG
jgi:hypothetical protein